MVTLNGTFSTLEAVQVICLLEVCLQGKPGDCSEIADLALAYSQGGMCIGSVGTRTEQRLMDYYVAEVLGYYEVV